jgi:hypothetical protein
VVMVYRNCVGSTGTEVRLGVQDRLLLDHFIRRAALLAVTNVVRSDRGWLADPGRFFGGGCTLRCFPGFASGQRLIRCRTRGSRRPDDDATRVLDRSRRYLEHSTRPWSGRAGRARIEVMLAQYPGYGNRYNVSTQHSPSFCVITAAVDRDLACVGELDRPRRQQTRRSTTQIEDQLLGS